jgi:DNA-binding transcriptional LysR family regulator
MKSNDDVFRYLATVVAIVEAGTFTAAADLLGVNRAAISKRVMQMEAELGIPLFERSTRRVKLTPAGKLLLERYQEASSALQIGIEEARESMSIIKGNVNVSCTSSLAIHWLGPLLYDFAADNPEIRVILNANYGEPSAQESDIELRMTREPPPDRSVRHLTKVSWAFYASAEYIQRFGVPTNPDSLAKHRFVVPTAYDRLSTFRHRMTGESMSVRPNSPITSNLQEVIFELVKRGKGIGLLPNFLLASQREESSLQEVLADWILEGLPAETLFAIHAPAKYLRASTRAVLNHLSAATKRMNSDN